MKRSIIKNSPFVLAVEAQKGCCWLCQKEMGYKKLCIDHDHKTGEIRKLLCRDCNLMLGLIEKNFTIYEEYAQLIDRIGEYLYYDKI